MRIKCRRRDKGIEQDGTAGLPPAGADYALFGTKVEMPYLERSARDKAHRSQRRASRRAEWRATRRKVRTALRQALRPGLVLVLDVLGCSGLVYTAWLIWVPLAWGLSSALALALAWVLDARPPDAGGE